MWIQSLIIGLIGAVSIELPTELWDGMLQAMYKSIFDSISEFLTGISAMGVQIFSYDWVNAVVEFFTLFGWSLFAVGTVVAVFDIAIEYQSGHGGNIRSLALHVLKGFFACSLIGVLPITLYKFCVTLQSSFGLDLSAIFSGQQSLDVAKESLSIFEGYFAVSGRIQMNMYNILAMIAYGYCCAKCFFANVKRGGILLIQIAVGSLYMFSIPRGYDDQFNQWCKQVIALCLTAFLQTTLLFLGLLTFQEDMLLGFGIMLAANEVPRIAQIFGLDSSVKVSVMNVVHSTTTAVNLARSVSHAFGGR